MITTPAHALTFGALDLLGHDTTGAYWFEALGDDAEWGNPVPVEKAITSFLQDGAIVGIESYDNREMNIRVTVVSATTAGLAAGESALFGEVGKRNVLTWTPPESTGSFAGVSCVFDVVSSSIDFDFDDVKEFLALERTYKLTIKALPFARSDTLTTVSSPAPPATTPVNTLVDACTSTTGWSTFSIPASPAPSLSTSGGDVVVSKSFAKAPSYQTVQAIRTGTISMTGTPFLRITFSDTVVGGIPNAGNEQVYLNGLATAATLVARNGNTRWYSLGGITSITALKVQGQAAFATTAGSIELRISDIYKTDNTTLSTTAGQRQTYRSMAVGGSARTQGNLTLADPTVALGSTLVYTTPTEGASVQPPLRTLRTNGSTETTDTSLVSQKYSDLATLHTFDIPADNVAAGAYLLMARLKHTSAASYAIAWAGKSRMGLTNLDASQSGSQSVALAAGVWTIAPIANMVLPTRTMGSAGLVRIELSGPSGVLLDEAWLFNVDTGRLTWVECGTATPAAGGSANRLWLDAASLDSPVASVWLGNASDRSDAYGGGSLMQSFAAHEFVPPSMNVFTVTTNSIATAVDLSAYPRFHSHVV